MDLPVQHTLRPETLAEALQALCDRPGARAIAGGTDLVVMLRDGRRQADTLVDLGRVAPAGISLVDEQLVIGAATTMDVIAASLLVRERHPALAAAAAQVGAWPIQCRATLGGNLANASPAADTAPPLLVADARLRLCAAAGARELGLDEFFLGPGRSALARDELIVEVVVPCPPRSEGSRGVERFWKVGPRREQIISMVSLAGRITQDGSGKVVAARIALGAVAPTPVRARTVEAFLLGRALDESTQREALRVLQKDIAPIDDVRAPAHYRRVAAAVLLDRLLAEVGHG
jgi:CO/xanthine dehydrogenase FAD-binding subunit